MSSESEFSDESDEHEVINLCYKVRKTNADDCLTPEAYASGHTHN